MRITSHSLGKLNDNASILKVITSMRFKYKRNDHITYIKYYRKNTALVVLHQDENIQINFNESKIVFNSNLHYPAIIRETLVIVTCKNSLCISI